MSFFHTHKWELVGKTYAAPVAIKKAWPDTIEQWHEVSKLMNGCTTFVWKCSDKGCDAIRTTECLGKEIEK